MVQQFCSQGRIPGAQKFGKSWAIPADAEKPKDPRLEQRPIPEVLPGSGLLDRTNLMPLMNTPFQPGQCLAAVRSMTKGVQRDIALAEYNYFSGKPEEAARKAAAYLTSKDMGARLSACLIYAYANLSIGEIRLAKFALGELNAALIAAGKQSPQFQAASAFVAAAGAVLLHLPLPQRITSDRELFATAANGTASLRLSMCRRIISI